MVEWMADFFSATADATLVFLPVATFLLVSIAGVILGLTALIDPTAFRQTYNPTFDDLRDEERWRKAARSQGHVAAGFQLLLSGVFCEALRIILENPPDARGLFYGGMFVVLMLYAAFSQGKRTERALLGEVGLEASEDA